ncbi:MAG: ankyrin repeat domain-containing protein [Alphaproteobacteria bacterium]|nr:ankyrin repeat domain-containing protein [Alphaproteobacteria bacterium]
MVKILLEHHANPATLNRKGYTPIVTAIKRAQGDIIQEFINSKALVDVVDNKKRCALHYAVNTNKDSIIQMILKANVFQADIPDYKGNTPAHLAAQKGNQYLVKQLLVAGADIFYITNNENKTADALLNETLNKPISHQHKIKRSPKETKCPPVERSKSTKANSSGHKGL